jgi:phospholipid-binding lipoprotein MlaA
LRYSCTFHRLVWGLVFAALRGSASGAAPSEAPRDASPVNFVDLTAGANPQSSSAATAGISGTNFIDLTAGASPTTMPESKGPHTRRIDLTTGASPDSAEDAGDDLTPQPDRITITADQINDPYEEGNRGRFETHVALHRHIIDPVESAYMAVVPRPVRVGLHNFLTNLETPSILANDVLQGEVRRAGGTLSRFVVNSTIGIAGIFDVADGWGIPYRDDDFGATLASYGVGEYPYLLVPVIGPSNPRDLTGKLVDVFLNPIQYVALPGGVLTSLGHTGLHEIDKRSEDAGRLDALTHTAPDPYAAERSTARARRRAEIRDIAERQIFGVSTPP